MGVLSLFLSKKELVFSLIYLLFFVFFREMPPKFRITHVHIPVGGNIKSAYTNKEVFLCQDMKSVERVLDGIEEKYPGRPQIIVDDGEVDLEAAQITTKTLYVRKPKTKEKVKKKKENKLRKAICAVYGKKPPAMKEDGDESEETTTTTTDAPPAVPADADAARAESLAEYRERMLLFRRTCSYCHTFYPPEMKLVIGFCAGCRVERYCLTKNCQLLHWDEVHRFECAGAPSN